MRYGVVPSHGPQVVDELVHQSRLCEKGGIDSIWIEEHHGYGYYWPTPLLALAALASHTEHIILGTNILILPLYDPVHIAEQMAVLDVMTGGRIILGTSIGDSPREFAMFRVQANQRGRTFEEQLQVIRALWRGETLHFKGEYLEYEGIQLSVQPIQESGPPIWVGGWGPRQIQRAVEFGDAWFPGPVADVDSLLSRLGDYEDQLAKRGIEPASRPRPLTRDVILMNNREQAWQVAEEELLPGYYQDYLESDHPLVGKGSGASFANLRLLAQGRFIIGDPSSVTEEVLTVIQKTQTDHFIFRLKLPGISPRQIRASIELLIQEVIPTLQKSEAAGATPQESPKSR